MVCEGFEQTNYHLKLPWWITLTSSIEFIKSRRETERRGIRRSVPCPYRFIDRLAWSSTPTAQGQVQRHSPTTVTRVQPSLRSIHTGLSPGSSACLLLAVRTELRILYSGAFMSPCFQVSSECKHGSLNLEREKKIKVYMKALLLSFDFFLLRNNSVYLSCLA